MVSFDGFVIDDKSPIYMQIIRYIKRGIAAGVIKNQEEIPSRRMLASLLGVNPNTVQKAYHMLEEENLIAARENYRIAMERYRLGQLSGIEMREAQKSLLDAEERILTAKYNTKLCEISLQQISGNVLTYLE